MACFGAVVVAQLAERSPPIPEVRGSNPVICEFFIEHLFTYRKLCEKTKLKVKEAGNGPFKNTFNYKT